MAMFTEGLDEEALRWVQDAPVSGSGFAIPKGQLWDSESVGSISGTEDYSLESRDSTPPDSFLTDAETAFTVAEEPAVLAATADHSGPSAPPIFMEPEIPICIPAKDPTEAPSLSQSLGEQESDADQQPALKPNIQEAPRVSSHTLLSGYAAWQTFIAYDACVRLCLNAWSRGCVEAPEFLQDECSVLRKSFGLQQLLLQHKAEVPLGSMREDNVDSRSAARLKMNISKLKVQVRKVKLVARRMSSGCQFPSAFSLFPARMRKLRLLPRHPLRTTSSAKYLNTGAQYVKQVSSLLKAGVNTLRSTAMLEAQDSHVCVLKLKSSTEEIARVQPGGGETSILHPESSGDDLVIEVYDSKGAFVGKTTVQLMHLTDDPNDRVRWWPLYREEDVDCVAKVQLFLVYSTATSEMGAAKWGSVGETVAYDILLDVAMRVHQFGRRNLRLGGSWYWLVSEFSQYYSVSDIYTKLRYISCIMDVATPTEDCLSLLYELLSPVIKARSEQSLSRQEKLIFADVQEQVSQLLALAFENYKSLDETAVSGVSEIFSPSSGVAAPALYPAVHLFMLLNDILSPETQEALRHYFQTAARKRSKRHMSETDEFVANSSEGLLADVYSVSNAYLKMKSFCMNILAEIKADIEIHKQQVLPSCIDLPNITAHIYNVEACNRLRAFLVSCPPSGPAPPVGDLLVATADFQRELLSWNIRPVKGGVDARDLFDLYIRLWIEDKRMQLLYFCKSDKVRLAGVATEHGTAPFVEEAYEIMKETLNEYDVIVSRWPEYTFVLETAMAEVERAVITALEKNYADVLIPLREIIPRKLTKVIQFARRTSLSVYSVPNQLGIVLNTIKRLLDTLRPKLENQMKSWIACVPDEGGSHGRAVFGERLNEVTVQLRTKYRSLVQGVVEKLADNARMQPTTKLKKILQDTRGAASDAEMRDRMRDLSSQLLETIGHLHEVFSGRVFVAVCRGYWDRMAHDVLHFLEHRKENRTWYKSSYLALGVLDEIFASQMQRLQGHSLQDKDLEPPRSAMDARSMLSGRCNGPDVF